VADVCDSIASFNDAVSCTQHKWLWDDQTTNELRSTFGNEISLNSISLDVVRAKIKGNEMLGKTGCRRVYDKLRRVIRQTNSSGDVSNTAAQASLPVEKEPLQTKLDKMVFSETADSDDDMIPATVDSSTMQKLYTPTEFEVLQVQCKDIIHHGRLYRRPE